MAITETYVDPAIAGASGAGTVGDPYGDLQHALDTMTRDSTNGDRINIKAGTDEILGAAIDLSTYGTPAVNVPLVFQGYTTAAGDGGIGGISGAATYSIMAGSALFGVGFIDMHLHNTAGTLLLNAGNYWLFDNCEFDNTTTDCLRLTGFISYVNNCYFHNIGGFGIHAWNYGVRITNCYFEDGTNKFTAAIGDTNNVNGVKIESNIIKLTSNGSGISWSSDHAYINNNTIYSSGGTGAGIVLDANVKFGATISSNYIEGFSGAGGRGVQTVAGSIIIKMISNRYYNNTTHESLSGSHLNDSDNSATAASALTNPGGGDFSVGTDLKAGAYPTSFKGSSTNQYMDIGAAQRREQAIVIAGRHNVLLRR